MANQRIDQLNAETAPAAADVLPVFSIAGSDTKKITVKNLVQQGAALIDDGSIPGSKVNLTTFLAGTIVNADINANAEIAVSKLADGAARQLLQTDAAGTGVEWTSNIDIPGTLDVTSAATFDSSVAVTGALTKSGNNVVTVGDSGTVTSTMLLDGTIVNADVNASAAIAYSKLATLPSGNIVLGSSTNVATSTAVTGDVTISDAGVTAIGTGVIVNADINASAAIADTKLATIATAGKVSNSATTAASANTASAIVARDASGNFTAGTITAALTGTASGNLVSGGALGTPSSGTLTSCTGLPISTGVSGLGTGAATFLATPSSANLAALLTDETGTGATVFANSPTLVSPALGTPSSGVLTNCTNLPVATSSVVGAVSIPAAGGLALTGGGALSHSNAVAGGASTRSGITYDLQGHIVSTVALVASDLPAATTAAKGAVIAGTGLAVDANGILSTGVATTSDLGGVKIGSEFGLNGSNQLLLATQANVAGGTAYPKVTVNSKGVVTAGAALTAGDIPNLDASKITTGSVDIARIAANTITGAKVANYAVTKIGDTQPTADHIGQFFFNPLSRDLFLWDGNVFQPIGISVGEIVFAGTFDASAGGGTGHVASVTSEGTAIGLVQGSPLPAAATVNNRYYLVVSEAGTITSGNAPNVALSPPDIILSTGLIWTEVDVSQTFTSVNASQVSFTPEGTITAANVQSAIEEVNNEKLGLAGGTITGNLEIGTTGSLSFEGSTANSFETFITAVDPTADRTITFPNISGTVITTGDTGTVTSTMLLDGTIVDADISATAEISVSKLADGAARQLLQTDAAGTGVEWASNIDIPGTLDVTSAATFDSTVAVTGALTKSGSNVVTVADTGTVTSTMLLDGTILNADINASAAIVDTKLATIATAGKVSNSATTATSANTPSAIVARDASGNFTAGTITAALTGTASGNLVSGGALGTPSSGTLTNCTFPTLNQSTTGNAATVTTNANLTGDVTSVGNATSIASGVIVNADINASAAIEGSKIVAATTSVVGAVQLSDSTSTTSSVLAATPTAVKAAYDLAAAALPKSGGTVTGNLEIGTAGSLTFEGATANAFELSLAIVDPTADRTITLPDISGTVITTGDTGTVTSTMLLDNTIVDADVNASAAIAYSKLATLTSGNILVGSSANVATSTAVSGDVTISNTGVTAIASGVIVDADINASAAIADTKLATIATALKVSNSATTAASANTPSAIVARDASGNFTAGTITAALTGTASSATALATARTIQGVSFDGTANITVATAGSGISVTGTAIANTGVLSVNGNAGAITNIAATNAVQSFTVAQRGTVSALGAVAAGTTTLDLATANNFSLSLPAGGTVTLANPSNQTAGQSGVVTITQNGTTAALVAYGGNWKFQSGAPSVSTTLSSVNVIAYYVESSSRITAQLLTNTIS